MPNKLDEADPIWGDLPAEVFDWDYGGRRVQSWRCGGRFEISATLIGKLHSLPATEKAKLTGWVLERNRFTEEEWPTITKDVIEAVVGRRAMPFIEKCDRLLELLISYDYRPGQFVPWAAGGIMTSQSELARQDACAWCEAASDNELYALNRQMVELGYFSQTEGKYTLAADGLKRMDELRSSGPTTDQVFVAMWFDGSTTEAYDKGIEKAVLDAGYRPMRIDKKEHANKIDDEIIAEIRRSHFVIADFTCRVLEVGKESVGVPRGGVYYEAGFAQGLGIPVVWTVRADQIELVHFDTRQYNHITWSSPQELREKLYHRIGAMFGHRFDAPGLFAS